VSGALDRTIKVWDAKLPSQSASAGHKDRVTTCVFSPDSTRAVTGGDDGRVYTWDATTGSNPKILPVSPVACCDFSPDGRMIAVASGYSSFRLVDAETGESVAAVGNLKSGDSFVFSCAYSPGGCYVVAAYEDTSLRIWNTKLAIKAWNGDSGADPYVCQLPGQGRRVTACAYSPNGLEVVSGYRDGALIIWRLNGESRLDDGTLVLSGHPGDVTDCAFSPDALFVVSSSTDKTLKLWNAASGELIATLSGDTGEVNACDFSPDGRFVVSASADRTLRFWEVASGKQVCEFQEGSGAPTGLWASGKTASGGTWVLRSGATAAAWSPNGKRVVAGFDFGSVYLLRLQSSEIGPPIVTAWCGSHDEEFAAGCPFCRRWFYVPAGALGSIVSCGCGEQLKLNSFTIDADWRAIARAWRGDDG
jgi:WD40 repeat protein